MKLVNIEKWGEHNLCLSYEHLRIPFEEYMQFEFYGAADIEWNQSTGFYQNIETELRFQGFCAAAQFMCYYKDILNET